MDVKQFELKLINVSRPDAKTMFGLFTKSAPITNVLMVSDIQRGSLADQVGLLIDDHILAIDKKRVFTNIQVGM